MTQKTDPASRRHTWLRAVVFAAKTWVFRARRFFFGPRVTWLEILEHRPDAPLAAESRTVLRTSTVAAELRLQEGKIHNLAVAARYLNGLRIPAGEVFSFWRHVPRPTRRSGFKEGRELREVASFRVWAEGFASSQTRFTLRRWMPAVKSSSATRTLTSCPARRQRRDGMRRSSGTMWTCVSDPVSICGSRWRFPAMN